MRKKPPVVNELAIELLRSRYRVFLTRGIFGTFVHFEDPETKAYLAPALEITQVADGERL